MVDAPLEIETDRLLLRTLGPGEEAALQEMFTRCADHFRILSGLPAPDPDAAAREIAGCAATPGRDVALLSLVQTGEAVGAIGWWAGNPEADKALIGMVMIAPEHRRQGLAREALSGLQVWLVGRGMRALRTAFQRRRLPVHPIVRGLGFREMSIRDHAALGLGSAGISLWEKPLA
ncbi:MAG TPA: GNAT family N-acetyltransferase [Longimicrobium sp.]|jgi:GNAT superfamily N-acetyltransferase|uniref:GNAT family N-acetyltransferase n=1 Tax=Longimicrobium sp. TaxID=2029185 RepID=UPI002ED98100